MRLIRYTLKYWLPLAAAISAVCGTIYLAVQQDMRMGLNDPQIQMAEDAAHALESGTSPTALMPVGVPQVDIAQSLAPYMIIFDAQGKPLASGAILHGSVPVPPPGVFDFTRKNQEDRISWQPEPGVRSAVVIVAAKNGQAGFALAGRGMREVENRESQLTTLVGAGWSGGLILTFVLVVPFEILPFTRTKA